MNQSNIVILGGGMVAGYAAKQLVELGLPKGELAILSADNAVPYERPPLSKTFLAGKDSEDTIKINPEDFYKQHGTELRLQCEVAAVDVKRKRLIFKNSEEFGFGKNAPNVKHSMGRGSVTLSIESLCHHLRLEHPNLCKIDTTTSLVVRAKVN